MSWIVVNGYKIEVDVGIFVDGKRVRDEFTYEQVLDACRKDKPKVSDRVMREFEDERSERQRIIPDKQESKV